jgi:hypothetical protein
LTAEVFQALDLLPRAAFLGKILRTCVTGAPETVNALADEVETLAIHLLPGDIFLQPDTTKPLSVQPDVIINSTSVYCLVEAKRIRPGARFQPEQLTREYLAVVQEATITAVRKGPAKRPLLLLVLPSGPEIAVAGTSGKMDIPTAVSSSLETVLRRCKHELRAALPADLSSVIAYTTWDSLANSLTKAQRAFTNPDESVRGSAERIANTALAAIRWHG